MLRVPENLDPAAAAPLLCVGITTYSPLRHWGAGEGKKVGVVGLGIRNNCPLLTQAIVAGASTQLRKCAFVFDQLGMRYESRATP